MNLVFDDQAIADLQDIYNWIAEDSPTAAKTVTEGLFSSVELLISFPFMGHAGRDPETFEWVVPRLPYVVVYEVAGLGWRKRMGQAATVTFPSFSYKNA
jgi:plasmid stabilization system protein ParE